MTVNKKLSNIQKIVNKEMNVRKQKEYNETILVFDKLKKFIKEKGLMLYGGAALNALVQKKIYKKYDLPDYDFLSYDAKSHSKELADLYGKQGYEYTESKPGTHFGTYKVFASFIPVADITQVPLHLFNRMKKTAVYIKDLDIYTVPVDYLRMAIYIELSRPAGDISRWSKIYERLQLFNKYYPISKPSSNSIYIKNINESENIQKMLTVIRDYIIFKKLVIFGSYALSIFKQKKDTEFPKVSSNMSYFDIISLNAEESIYEITLILKNMGFQLSKQKQNINVVSLAGSRAVAKHKGLSENEFFGTHYSLKYKGKLIIHIFQSQACYSYFNYKNLRIATINTMLSFYYAFLFSERDYFDHVKIKQMIETLYHLRKSSKNNKNIRYKEFQLNCYGKQKFLKNLKIERYKRIKEKDKNMVIYRPKVKTKQKIVKETLFL